MSLIRSSQRVADHGEVFTPEWMVKAMLDLVKPETEIIKTTFLEPACGSGNFLAEILQRKLAAVDRDHGRNEFERRHYALLGLMCIYGIELLADNIKECRENLLEIFAEHLNLDEADELYIAASYVLSQNIVHGDARKMLTDDGQPLTFAEWGYLGKGKFQRRDFRLEKLTLAVSFKIEAPLLAAAESREKVLDLFKPARDYVPAAIGELPKAVAVDDIQEAA